MSEDDRPSTTLLADRHRAVLATVVVALVALCAGALITRLFFPRIERVVEESPAAGTHKAKAQKVEWWTCSMHPQIKRPAPGLCPICGMALIPMESAEEELGPRQIRISPVAAMLMDIRVSPVERRFADVGVRMVGLVDYDESRVANIAAWVGGRIERLFVDYTGIAVRKGDHLVEIYSPDLLSAQEELIQAKAAARELEKSDIPSMRDSAKATLQAAREKLRLWGITAPQIDEIESSGRVMTKFEIVAPIGGIVVEKMAKVGMYVQAGERIYTIADLSQVWVKLDAYESDLPWVRYGQKVSFEAEGLPGREFTGTVTFIDPVLDARTRTVKVRVNVPNPDGTLRPEMFVRATLKARVAAEGRVMAPDLAGKWICRMHPEVIKDATGSCDVCGMPLERAEDLGYVPVVESYAAKPLLVPASAPLITGKRAIVYVRVSGDDNGTLFEGREIELGPRAGDFYVVESGLADNDLVVTQGNFKIDASLQLQAKPSMMNPEGAPVTGHQHGTPAARTAPAVVVKRHETPPDFAKQLGAVWTDYRALTAALASDDLSAASAAARKTQDSLAAVDMKLLEGDAHADWMKLSDSLSKSLKTMLDAKDIEGARRRYVVFSDALALILKSFDVEPAGPIYRLHCPMAFNNRGADWLQETKEVSNPYFGAAMPRCGEVVETLSTGEASK